MIHFECDYTEGCCPQILEALTTSNFDQTTGYGNDDYCHRAREIIKTLCKAPHAEVHFLTGGTQANLTVIASALKSYQGVLSPETGHITAHETGAIEACGHKVLTLPTQDGKITALQVENYCKAHYADASREHTVQPGMVYISFPTETGLIYTKQELQELYTVCKNRELFLFIDGARLGYGLATEENDCSMEDIAALCDVFYIGGTKVGALFGEAVVITNPALQKDFRYMIKQKGGMLAKGRLLGIQFETLLKDGLYFSVAKKAVAQALQIKRAFKAQGISLLFDSPTNQQFPILTKEQLTYFEKEFSVNFWQQTEDGKCAVRFCTSWATKDEAMTRLLDSIERMPK